MSTSIYRGPAYRIPMGMAKFGIGTWEERLGNHRAVVRVVEHAGAVCAHVPERSPIPLALLRSGGTER